MKAQMESTSVIDTVTLPDGTKARARRWDGVSEKGVRFCAWVLFCQVPAAADQAEFERALAESKIERELVSFDYRMVAD
jgi:hypothetical protein